MSDAHILDLVQQMIGENSPLPKEAPAQPVDFSGGGGNPNRGHVELLLEFLRDHDAACPLCGYNVRGLTRPVCPECKQELALTVGGKRIHLGWLIIALAPGLFSGIAACFAAIPTTAIYLEDGEIVWPFLGAVLFGWMSGLCTIILATKRPRIRFIAQPRSRQRWIAIGIWAIHFAAAVMFGLAMDRYI